MAPPKIDLNRYLETVQNTLMFSVYGKVAKVVGMLVEGWGNDMAIGSMCRIESPTEGTHVLAEAVGFSDHRTLLMALGDTKGIKPGSLIVPLGEKAQVGVSWDLLGRVIDGLGHPIDGKGTIAYDKYYPLYAEPINPVERRRIDQPIDVGVRAINGLLTLGKGQRIGIFAGSGLGKSSLLGMVARYTKADVNVIALIGERGREVKEFIENNLGEEGLKRSVVIVATSDQPPLIRMRGAYIATAVSEFFRDEGRDVILMMDSITRFAMSAREVGLAIGEPPTTRGYTPSVFAQLPKLLERTGTGKGNGSITGIYSVLVEGDDLNEPVADTLRSTLDGHIVLARELAQHNHYPAIDVLGSISRVMVDVTTGEHLESVRRLVQVLSTYKKAEDLINIGAYAAGSNKEIDYAIRIIDKINAYLRQDFKEKVSLEESVSQLKSLFE